MSLRVLRRVVTIALTIVVSLAVQLSAYRAVRCKRADALMHATTQVAADDAGAEQTTELEDAACAPVLALLPGWPALREPMLERELEPRPASERGHRIPTRLDRPPRAA